MAKTKNVPMRTCIACRQMKPKKEMTRVVKTADGEIFADPTGKVSGRGAYICGDEECLKKLNDKKLLHKAFSLNVSQEVYQGVEEEILGEK
ncbi:MAG: YlxR family protein [Clostridiales bacterium]|nr:YlxR family protein [Clostridiales bacterium]